MREGDLYFAVRIKRKRSYYWYFYCQSKKLGEDLQSYIEAYTPGTAEEEASKIKEALAYAAEVLQTNIKTLRDKGMLEQAGIMEAHRMMVQDPML